ncbi:tRNA guanosine(15) transglycosylase TgtA [Halobacteriales archaeon QS_8_69_26]|nr:MAG: tRNA guanosine(15) transglycosylase TgtA [Halobacteriales archaeon QS_8_69_26]
MREHFEVRAVDAAGRVGELTVPRADRAVTTPALLPVVNPNLDTVEPRRLGEEFGAAALITNAYIVHGDEDLRERALSGGIHGLLEFDGVVMTDSGSFQLAEYGEITVTTREILEFQQSIGSDIATPVDVPTPPDADRETALADLETTQERLETADAMETGETLVTAPVQGSTHPDLRERAGRHAAATDLDVFPVGAMVPLLEDYRFAEAVEAVAAAKRGLDADCPVHLFGAGHPMMFALAAAVGCDLFDSAAYALYARDDRYLTARGTRHLENLTELPCECPVCSTHDPDDLRGMDDPTRERRLAEHNLHVSFGEIRRVRDAIRAGDLLELVETRARAHPAMLDGYRALLDEAPWLERTDPATKRTFRYLSAESARRPEVLRHRERLDRLSPPDRLLLTEGHEPDGDHDETWSVVPPFGPVPPALSRSYPFTAAVPERRDDDAERAAARAVARLAAEHPETDLTLAHQGWGDGALSLVPEGVELVDVPGDLGEDTTEDPTDDTAGDPADGVANGDPGGDGR